MGTGGLRGNRCGQLPINVNVGGSGAMVLGSQSGIARVPLRVVVNLHPTVPVRANPQSDRAANNQTFPTLAPLRSNPGVGCTDIRCR